MLTTFIQSQHTATLRYEVLHHRHQPTLSSYVKRPATVEDTATESVYAVHTIVIHLFPSDSPHQKNKGGWVGGGGVAVVVIGYHLPFSSLKFCKQKFTSTPPPPTPNESMYVHMFVVVDSSVWRRCKKRQNERDRQKGTKKLRQKVDKVLI